MIHKIKFNKACLIVPEMYNFKIIYKNLTYRLITTEFEAKPNLINCQKRDNSYCERVTNRNH